MSFWPKKVSYTPTANTPVCERCKLYKSCINSCFKISGNGEKGILLIAEHPNKEEDLTGTPINTMLSEALLLMGVDIHRDCWYTYSLLCRPTEKVKDVQVKLCSEKLHKTIKKLKPQKIIPFGKLSTKSLIIDRLSLKEFPRWVGQQIPDTHLNSWIYPNYSTSHVGMNYKDPVVFDIWFDTLQQAVEHNSPLRELINTDNIIYITECKEAKTVIENITKNAKEIAFDFETTGIKPHAKGHKILYVSISDREDRVFTMPFFNEDGTFLSVFKALMLSDVGKIAHNIKYETMWTLNKLGIHVNNWVWDTMVAAHCLNNLTGVSGLKFQSYVNYGLAGYEKDIDKYISSDKEHGCNSLNTMEFAPKKIALQYCGIDSLLLKRLKAKQVQEMTPFIKTGYDFFHSSLPTLSKMESTGIHVDGAYLQRKDTELTEELNSIEGGLINCELGKLWEGKTKNALNPNSGEHIAKLLFKFCGIAPIKTTDKGNPSVDDSVIQELSILLSRDDSNKHIVDFLDSLSNFRKLKKVHSTYVKGMLKEIVNGKIYPLVNLNIVASFRSSMDSPNLHNIPKRNKKIKNLVRGGFKPTPGNMFLEVDFANLEVRGGCCYHQDPTMIDYIMNPTNDMHRDCAMDLFILPEHRIHKDVRQVTKGGFVFAQTYGSFYEQIALSLWKDVKELTTTDGIPIRKHLASKGITNIDKFTTHVRKVENIFWNKRFPVYKQWREDQLDYYKHNGFIKLKTGFICKGPLRRTQIFNMSIQGSSFHILLWCLSEIDREFTKRNLKSKIVIQIHDAILFDVFPPELDEVKEIAIEVMTKRVREAWDWIIVPLAVEFEQSEINGNWAEMK